MKNKSPGVKRNWVLKRLAVHGDNVKVAGARGALRRSDKEGINRRLQALWGTQGEGGWGGGGGGVEKVIVWASRQSKCSR